MTVEDLLVCKKQIQKKRKPIFQIDQRHQKMNIELKCDYNLKMTMFLRRLIERPEDFSIGLRIDTPNPFADYTLVLVRFQGPHGGQSLEKDINNLHNDYHIHVYSEDDFKFRRKMASYKEKGDFNSFEEALLKFLEYCNIEDTYNIFDDERQRVMQFEMCLN